MSIFGRFKSGVAKVFGAAKRVFAPAKQTTGRSGREEKAAEIHREGQKKRRNRLLEERVKAGQSSEVYPDKKGKGGSSVRLEQFLDGEPFTRFASSCIYALVFDRFNQHLYLQFLGGKGKNRGGPGRWCQYRSVNAQEATSIYNAASKGVWSWDFLRVRGSVHGTKKPFTMDVAPNYQAIMAAAGRANTKPKMKSP